MNDNALEITTFLSVPKSVRVNVAEKVHLPMPADKV